VSPTALPPYGAELLACLADGPTLVSLWDPQERLCAANRSFLEAYEVTLDAPPTWEELMRRCHRERRGLLIETDDIDAWLVRVRQHYRRQPVRRFESDLVDGRWLSVTETLHADGWVLVVACDITPLKANEQTLRRAREQAELASLTDPLTGLGNRRAVFARLGELLAEAAQMRFPLAVAAIDLDDFKAVNDRHGHAVGDEVLVGIASLLRSRLRPLDSAGRIGGEEFLLLLANTDADGARAVVDRLREAVSNCAPSAAQPALRVTFSAGVAVSAAGETVDALYARADDALYLAKAAGRDRCVVSGATAGLPPDA
jgi:diguanylate cyclase (GGDEF)-like protein